MNQPRNETSPRVHDHDSWEPHSATLTPTMPQTRYTPIPRNEVSPRMHDHDSWESHSAPLTPTMPQTRYTPIPHNNLSKDGCYLRKFIKQLSSCVSTTRSISVVKSTLVVLFMMLTMVHASGSPSQDDEKTSFSIGDIVRTGNTIGRIIEEKASDIPAYKGTLYLILSNRFQKNDQNWKQRERLTPLKNVNEKFFLDDEVIVHTKDCGDRVIVHRNDRKVTCRSCNGKNGKIIQIIPDPSNSFRTYKVTYDSDKLARSGLRNADLALVGNGKGFEAFIKERQGQMLNSKLTTLPPLQTEFDVLQIIGTDKTNGSPKWGWKSQKLRVFQRGDEYLLEVGTKGNTITTPFNPYAVDWLFNAVIIHDEGKRQSSQFPFDQVYHSSLGIVTNKGNPMLPEYRAEQVVVHGCGTCDGFGNTARNEGNQGTIQKPVGKKPCPNEQCELHKLAQAVEQARWNTTKKGAGEAEKTALANAEHLLSEAVTQDSGCDICEEGWTDPKQQCPDCEGTGGLEQVVKASWVIKSTNGNAILKLVDHLRAGVEAIDLSVKMPNAKKTELIRKIRENQYTITDDEARSICGDFFANNPDCGFCHNKEISELEWIVATPKYTIRLCNDCNGELRSTFSGSCQSVDIDDMTTVDWKEKLTNTLLENHSHRHKFIEHKLHRVNIQLDMLKMSKCSNHNPGLWRKACNWVGPKNTNGVKCPKCSNGTLIHNVDGLARMKLLESIKKQLMSDVKPRTFKQVQSADIEDGDLKKDHRDNGWIYVEHPDKTFEGVCPGPCLGRPFGPKTSDKWYREEDTKCRSMLHDKIHKCTADCRGCTRCNGTGKAILKAHFQNTVGHQLCHTLKEVYDLELPDEETAGLSPLEHDYRQSNGGLPRKLFKAGWAYVHNYTKERCACGNIGVGCDDPQCEKGLKTVPGPGYYIFKADGCNPIEVKTLEEVQNLWDARNGPTRRLMELKGRTPSAVSRRLAEDEYANNNSFTIFCMWIISGTFLLIAYIVGRYIERAKRDAMQRGRTWEFPSFTELMNF